MANATIAIIAGCMLFLNAALFDVVVPVLEGPPVLGLDDALVTDGRRESVDVGAWLPSTSVLVVPRMTSVSPLLAVVMRRVSAAVPEPIVMIPPTVKVSDPMEKPEIDGFSVYVLEPIVRRVSLTAPVACAPLWTDSVMPLTTRAEPEAASEYVVSDTTV